MKCINCGHEIEYHSTPSHGFWLHKDTNSLHSDRVCICGCRNPIEEAEKQAGEKK